MNDLIKAYINAISTDVRDKGSRKKTIGEGVGNLELGEESYYEPSEYVDPDYEKYLIDLENYNALRERQNILQGDDLDEDVRYIKSGGKTFHEEGGQRPRNSGP